MTIPMIMLEFLDHFMVRAVCSSLLLCALCGPMGCLVLWQRLGFLGDTLAHATLFGVCIAALSHLSPLLCVLVVTIVLALLLARFRDRAHMAMSTLLAIVAQSALALGVIGLSITPERSNMTTFLFGDLLALSNKDILTLLVLVPVGLIVIKLLWIRLLKITLSEDIAASDGLNINFIRTAFMVTLALTVAIASQLVGILMVTSLMVLPAAAARVITKTPESMAVAATLIAMVGAIFGLYCSWMVNIPTTPMITLCFLGILLILLVGKKITGSRSRF